MLVYGKQIFHYVLERHPQRIKKVYLLKEIDQKLFTKLKKLGIEIVKVDNKKAQALARGGNHQGFLMEIEDLEFLPLSELKTGKFLVLLYGVTDVGNIGSIVRTSYALGVDGVVVSGIRNLKLEGVVRTSSGAALDMPMALVPNIYDLIKELKDAGFLIYGADMSGEDVRKIRFEGKRALLLGSEGEGIPKKALQKCDRSVAIKMARPFDSLNVSAAGAIFVDRMRDE
jgi:23S rRNA (guanosine2251-2'-O)-methyltransferase